MNDRQGPTQRRRWRFSGRATVYRCGPVARQTDLEAEPGDSSRSRGTTRTLSSACESDRDCFPVRCRDRGDRFRAGSHLNGRCQELVPGRRLERGLGLLLAVQHRKLAAELADIDHLSVVGDVERHARPVRNEFEGKVTGPSLTNPPCCAGPGPWARAFRDTSAIARANLRPAANTSGDI